MENSVAWKTADRDSLCATNRVSINYDDSRANGNARLGKNVAYISLNGGRIAANPIIGLAALTRPCNHHAIQKSFEFWYHGIFVR